MKGSEVATHGRRAVIELREKIISGSCRVARACSRCRWPRCWTFPHAGARACHALPEGLLDRLPNGGFVVRRFGYADVIDSIELRGVMEGTAARLAAERGVAPEALARISDVVRKLDTCFGPGADEVDFDAYADLNEEFHHQLAGLAGSDIVRREVERASSLPFASPSAFLPNKTEIEAFRRSLRSAQEQHHALVEAIAAREGSRAEWIAREHARTARHNLEYIFSQDPELLQRIPGLALIHR
jgi:GntR family transcriptional regulator of vanillate catabolism